MAPAQFDNPLRGNGTDATDAADPGAPSPPWWRVGMVWLVVGGPAVVVVAAIGTAVVAYRGADPVLTEAPDARQAVRQLGPETPAMLGRNHAATPAPR